MRLLVLSDPHYAGAAERARRGWERRAIRSPALRLLAQFYRRYLWLAEPTAHNQQVDAFLDRARSLGPDLVVANGDFSCDSAFIGIADDAAFESAQECLGKLRAAFADRLRVVPGDHELGKMSLFGGLGGPRLESWRRCRDSLGFQDVWAVDAGSHRLVGMTSSLAAIEAFRTELEPGSHGAWEELRRCHNAELVAALSARSAGQRIILFCHDPTALPYLAEIPEVQAMLPHLDATVLGHLHSEFIFRTSRLLAGLPRVSFLGQTVRRLSGALSKARHWRPFRPLLCPSTAGIQLLKDGGYLSIDLRPGVEGGPRFERGRLPWA